MTPVGLLAMRKAAALAFAVPGLEVDVHHGDRLLARVERRFDGRTLSPDATLLAPCAFRTAVGRAHAHAGSGGTAVFLGLAADTDPALSYHMPFTGAVRPLGLLVARVGETMVHVFATQRPIHAVQAVIRNTLRHPAVSKSAAISASWDPVLGVTLVSAEVGIGLLPTIRPHVEAEVESLMILFGTEEVTQAVAARASRASG